MIGRARILALCGRGDENGAVGGEAGTGSGGHSLLRLLERRVLAADGRRRPLRLAFPAAPAARWLPGLYADAGPPKFFIIWKTFLRRIELTGRFFGDTLMKYLCVSLAGLLAAGATLGAQPASPADQIASAILAAPKDRRAAATVLGYNAKNEVVNLRKGTNDLICLADDPAVKGISVACYHKDLEPFMARGRELAAQYKGKDRHEQRWKEVDEGKVKIPKEARMLYVLTGTSFDAVKGELADSYLRWVIYSPYATPESTGLTTKSGSEPWLMYPGTAGAHIMISPPQVKK
jgi:hypothetical protein